MLSGEASMLSSPLVHIITPFVFDSLTYLKSLYQAYLEGIYGSLDCIQRPSNSEF